MSNSTPNPENGNKKSRLYAFCVKNMSKKMALGFAALVGLSGAYYYFKKRN